MNRRLVMMGLLMVVLILGGCFYNPHGGIGPSWDMSIQLPLFSGEEQTAQDIFGDELKDDVFELDLEFEEVSYGIADETRLFDDINQELNEDISFETKEVDIEEGESEDIRIGFKEVPDGLIEVGFESGELIFDLNNDNVIVREVKLGEQTYDDEDGIESILLDKHPETVDLSEDISITLYAEKEAEDVTLSISFFDVSVDEVKINLDDADYTTSFDIERTLIEGLDDIFDDISLKELIFDLKIITPDYIEFELVLRGLDKTGEKKDSIVEVESEKEIYDLGTNLLSLIDDSDLDVQDILILADIDLGTSGKLRVAREDRIELIVEQAGIPLDFTLKNDRIERHGPEAVDGPSREDLDRIEEGFRQAKLVTEITNTFGFELNVDFYVAGGRNISEDDLFQDDNLFKEFSVKTGKSPDQIELGLSFDDVERLTEDDLHFGIEVTIPAGDIQIVGTDSYIIGNTYALIDVKVNQ